MAYALPTPIRVVAMLTLLFFTTKFRMSNATTTADGAGLLVLAAQVHALAFHAPSLWSSRVHKQSCLLLTEHILYYGALQIVVIEVILRMLLQPANLQIIACYCGLNYAWSIGKLAVVGGGTLAPYGVMFSLLVYVGVTIPYYLYYYYDFHGGGEDASRQHLLAWTVADCCHYAFSLFFSLSQSRADLL